MMAMTRRVRNRSRRAAVVGALMLAGVVAAASAAPGRENLIVADFEGQGYRPWVAEGEAFGEGPARGALPGQMAVEGFEGRGLVSSFLGGDEARGVLTSPPFRLERRYLNFLIGGGKFPGETCLNLVVGGKVVRSATGPNDSPGGSERLDWASWDVAEWDGKDAALRAVDRRGGGWGHLSVDQVVQSDRPRGLVPASREFTADHRYLELPVRRQAPVRRVRVEADGRAVREFDIRLADGAGEDFRTFLDLGPFLGRKLRAGAELPAGSEALGRLTQAAEVPGAADLYREKGRPQFHFTSRRGWLNDPNGLVWLDGQYHLFYQHNPYGWDWGNMHWGHAVSPDLVHWTELPIALYPRQYGDWCFSGSAVIDRGNTSGFGAGGVAPMVAAFTSTGRGECIVFSLDRGRTWAEYAGNPVVRHEGRDPRLFWHGPTGRWVMAVYDEENGRRSIIFHTSPDLKTWTAEGKADGFFECPDLFELPVEGEPGRTLWVLSAADGEYVLGQFDGRRFRPETGKLRNRFGDYYAAQTFSDTPDGRRVQIGWGRDVAFPGMPFNQQMTLPCELALRPTPEGPRLFARPVAELEKLRVKSQTWRDLGPGAGDPLAGLAGELFDVRVEAEVGGSGRFSLAVPGGSVVYDAAEKTLACGKYKAPLAPTAGVVRVRVLIDRGSVEAFGGDGAVAISAARGASSEGPPVSFGSTGAGLWVRSLDIDVLESAWR